MDCRQILKLYQLYVDREMEDRLLDRIKEHMQECPDCQYRLKFEMEFTTTIKKKVRTRSAPQGLKERIKKKLE